MVDHQNHQNEINMKQEKGHMPENDIDPKQLYDIQNFFGFVKHFNLECLVNDAFDRIKDMRNGLCVMINTKSTLIADSNWNFGKNEQAFGREYFKKSAAEDELNVTYTLHFINQLKHAYQKFSTSSLFHIYTFGNDCKIVGDLSNKEQSIFKNPETVAHFKRELIGASMNRHECDLNKVISRMYNIEEKNSPPCFQTFLRMIVLTGSPSVNLDSKSLCSVLSSFLSKNEFNSVCANFLFFEDSFYFKNYVKSSPEFQSFVDFKEEDDSLTKSTDKLNYLIRIYMDGEELECKQLSDKITLFGRSLFDQSVKAQSTFNNMITDLVRSFDSSMKDFVDLIVAVDAETSSNRVDPNALKRNYDELKSRNLIQLIVDKVNNCLKEFYNNKNMKKTFAAEVFKELEGYKLDVKKLDNKIQQKGNKIIKFRFRLSLLERQSGLHRCANFAHRKHFEQGAQFGQTARFLGQFAN